MYRAGKLLHPLVSRALLLHFKGKHQSEKNAQNAYQRDIIYQFVHNDSPSALSKKRPKSRFAES